MIPNMSSDRILAYRIFQGELEKLSLKKQHSGVEILVMEYMRKRMSDMERKGHVPS